MQQFVSFPVVSGLFPLRGKFTLHALLIRCAFANAVPVTPHILCSPWVVPRQMSASVWPLIE